MHFVETTIEGAYIIEPHKLSDDRGFFHRLWCEKTLQELGLNTGIAQINTSFNNKKGTLRGLHFQQSPHQEVKIVLCTQGSVFDVMVDLRIDSPTYLQWLGVDLSQENGKQIYVPEGCAHGYQATSNNSAIVYSTSEFYEPVSECGLRWNDPSIDIKWPLEPVNLSDKDHSWPLIN